jgi:hypothetical protein
VFKFYFASIFQSTQHLYEKRERSASRFDIGLMNPDRGGPKNADPVDPDPLHYILATKYTRKIPIMDTPKSSGFNIGIVLQLNRNSNYRYLFDTG